MEGGRQVHSRERIRMALPGMGVVVGLQRSGAIRAAVSALYRNEVIDEGDHELGLGSRPEIGDSGGEVIAEAGAAD
jgi:hypothetical protein